MVKFGYAENLEEMLDRLKYDILYIENMSFLIDLKIMIHTVLIIFQEEENNNKHPLSSFILL